MINLYYSETLLINTKFGCFFIFSINSFLPSPFPIKGCSPLFNNIYIITPQVQRSTDYNIKYILIPYCTFFGLSAQVP